MVPTLGHRIRTENFNGINSIFHFKILNYLKNIYFKILQFYLRFFKKIYFILNKM